MSARALQICGTGSGVGKSVLVTALCRIFLQDGYRVAPFKAQNMALNSFVTKEDGEIGRAQAVQAYACKIEPTVDMNPILIKPTSDRKAQIVVRGKPIGNMSAVNYISYKRNAKNIVLDSFRRLANMYELVVIEGAGSPAEINLKSHDIVNLRMAEAVSCPAILVGDIDKGGVFAWIIGTLELLTEKEREKIKGIIINKFRGDKRLLKGGIRFLEKKTGIKVLGVIPYIKDLRIQEEDSIPLDKQRIKKTNGMKKINIDVVYLPHISNFTDFDTFEVEEDVNLSYAKEARDLDNPDVIIIPGSKNTIYDLSYLIKSGLGSKILSILNNERLVALIGICGGYQMLGERIYDPYYIESSNGKITGFGLLPVATTISKKKVLAQIRARHIHSGVEISGYEIHHGRTKKTKYCDAVFEIFQRSGKTTRELDGAQSENGRIWGTYIHGIFDSNRFRRDFLNRIRIKKDLVPLKIRDAFNRDYEFDKFAKIVRDNIDVNSLYKILNYDL